MPEANVLYSVTAAVVVGLIAWVAFVLKGAKEPWAREGVFAAPAPLGDDVPIEGADAQLQPEPRPEVEAKAIPDAKPEAKAGPE